MLSYHCIDACVVCTFKHISRISYTNQIWIQWLCIHCFRLYPQLWNRVQAFNKTSGTVFWPGSDVEIDGKASSGVHVLDIS